MSKITVEKISEEKKKQLGIPVVCEETDEWSVWECEPSTFDWQYAQKEIAYVYQGKVKVKTKTGEAMITKGDLVTFPKGLSCTWNVLEKIRKVYRFE